MEKVDGYVWCDRVGAVHTDSLDPYDSDDRCQQVEHRALFMPILPIDSPERRADHVCQSEPNIPECPICASQRAKERG